jgi:hypothetical protein
MPPLPALDLEQLADQPFPLRQQPTGAPDAELFNDTQAKASSAERNGCDRAEQRGGDRPAGKEGMLGRHARASPAAGMIGSIVTQASRRLRPLIG